jgi:peptidoglycan/LPS O-acetylase OafA/YrhL
MTTQLPIPSKRLYNLDYLRGLAALGIMAVHLSTLAEGPLSTQSFPGRYGVYGVSVFYIVSGLTLFFVYFDRIQINRHDLGNFFLRRFVRIFPLFWLVTFLTMFVRDIVPSNTRLLYNLTGLFAVVDRHGYIAPGAWSIGNELIFYLVFPVLVILSKKSKFTFYLLSCIILAIYLYFAFVKLRPSVSYLDQWLDYINPLNQLFLFLAGFLIGYFFHKKSIPPIVSPLCLAAGLALLFFYPAVINIVAGIPRIAFTIAAILICFAFYKTTFRLKGLSDRVLTTLGEISYAVYLIHPLVWYTLLDFLPSLSAKWHFHLATTPLIIICILVTLALSYCLHKLKPGTISPIKTSSPIKN